MNRKKTVSLDLLNFAQRKMNKSVKYKSVKKCNIQFVTLFFHVGSIGLKALFYYITTTTLGITLSVILSQTIRPGEWGSSDETNRTNMNPETHIDFVTVDTFLDLLR